MHQQSMMLKNQSEHEDSCSLEEGEEVSQHQESSEFVRTRCAGKKQLCSICKNALFKYTCPRCKEKTCGIACLNKHKTLRECSGKINPTDHVPKSQINQKMVEKDFCFVKDMLNSSDKVKKTLTGLNSITQQPKRFKILRVNAKKMYNINVLNAPSIIQRHRENISFYYVKSKEIFWVLEILYFKNCKSGECSRQVTLPISDSKKIGEVLPTDFLCRDLLVLGINTQKVQQFSVYILNRHSQFGKNQLKKKTIDVIGLNKERTLSESFIGLTIYQFPTLYLVHQSMKNKFLALHN